ncbi:MAG: carboxypeptidase-like regulatory domain-containing protein [Candidatus Neomarinimicrobiota bacterium]|nr:carboxypeptidase-like regulatory domain-containing protein [Candidatus Neomarinimicrobiota bacterium]
MAKQIILNKSFIRVIFVLFATVLVGQKPQEVTGTVLDGNGDRVVETTVLLLAEDGTEVQRTQTSKKRLGRKGGDFEFKKVAPGKYKIDIDGGDLGKLNADVEVSDGDVKLGDLTLSINEVPATDNTSDQQAADSTTPTTPPTEESVEFAPDPGKDYILNELSFEIKKMTAELKYLNEELENLKALSKMWVNPLAIYSKEIIMKNGSTVFGKVVYQDEESLKVETLVGYLIINRTDVVRIIDNVVTEEQAEYVPEQVRDSYTPPPMPKLAEPQYTSAERDGSIKYSANCVLMGNITEKKDAQGNIIFNGEIKNIGGRRSDFVKVDFVFRKNWSGETKTLTTFIKGGYHTFDSGITTDSTLLPGATGAFELYVPHDFGSFIGYSYVIDWEEYE